MRRMGGIILLLALAPAARAVTVEGSVSLANSNDPPAGMWVRFYAQSPSARTDSAQVDSTAGTFAAQLQPGVYQVVYRHGAPQEYAPYELPRQALLFDTTLAHVMLMPPLAGVIEGTLEAGDYDVVDTLVVPYGAAFTLLPGTALHFRPRAALVCQGQLMAFGLEGDSVVFTRRYPSPDSLWRGIRISGVPEASEFHYCVVEYAGGAETAHCGGLTIQSSLAVLDHCTFRDSHNTGSYSGGGALACFNARVAVDDCLFERNRAASGGALYVFNNAPDVQVRACRFVGNSGYEGGAVAVRYGSGFTARECLFDSNRAADGGAIYAMDSSIVEVADCRLDGNSNYPWSGGAAGVTSGGGATLRMTRCLVRHHTGGNHVIFLFRTTGEIAQCTFAGNVVSSEDEVLNLSESTLRLTSSIVAYTQGGPAIRFDRSPASEVRYSDFYDNAGGAFAGHTDPADAPVALGVIALTNALGDSCDTYYNIFLDPQFADTAAGDYHLTATSPCIDTGDGALPRDPDGSVADMGAYWFDFSGAARPGREPLPARLTLHAAYPNPFNAATTLAFELPRTGDVRLAVYDITGRQVSVLVERPLAAGRHEVHWQAQDLASGLYFARLEAGAQVLTQKVVLLK